MRYVLEILIAIVLGLMLLPTFHCTPGHCSPMPQLDVNRLATAIYWAEGGPHTRWPYGILHHYHHTSPRQACLNTIQHALRDWDGNEPFIHFLATRYAPVGSDTDVGTNQYWERNVSRLYQEAI